MSEASESLAGAVKSHLKTTATWEIVGGVLCLLAPLLAGLAVTILTGIGLLMAGVFVLRFADEDKKSRTARIVEGGLLVLLGAYLVLAPLAGLGFLTTVLAVMMILAGVARCSAALALRPKPGAGMLLAAGVLTALCGVLLLAQWPSSSVWAVGTLLGVSLLFGGFAKWSIAKAIA